MISYPRVLAVVSYGLFLTAVCSIALSYLLGGVRALDLLGLLLIPSFILYFLKLILEFPMQSRDFRLGLIVLIIAIGWIFFLRSKIDIATIDDNYHVAKMIAHAVRNDFDTRFEYIRDAEDERYFYVDFVESVWGILWRYLRFDFVVVLTQGLPLLILWRVMTEFFYRHAVAQGGLLSTAILLSLQIYWCQQGSGFIDSIVGTITALVLFLSYHILKKSETVTVLEVSALAVCSVLSILTKTSMIGLGFFGIGVSLWVMVRLFSLRQYAFILLPIVIGMTYALVHHYHVWQLKGHPLYPFMGVVGSEQIKGTGEFFAAHPWFRFLNEHNIHFHPLYVLGSWLFDYKYRSGLTASPWVGANGILWTYVVIPTLGWWTIDFLRQKRRLHFQPQILVLFIIFIYEVFFRFSIQSRFMLGFHSFILAWCFMWIWIKMRSQKNTVLQPVLLTVVFLLALGSYYFTWDVHLSRDKQFSVIEAQYQKFPTYINANNYRP